MVCSQWVLFQLDQKRESEKIYIHVKWTIVCILGPSRFMLISCYHNIGRRSLDPLDILQNYHTDPSHSWQSRESKRRLAQWRPGWSNSLQMVGEKPYKSIQGSRDQGHAEKYCPTWKTNWCIFHPLPSGMKYNVCQPSLGWALEGAHSTSSKTPPVGGPGNLKDSQLCMGPGARKGPRYK